MKRENYAGEHLAAFGFYLSIKAAAGEHHHGEEQALTRNLDVSKAAKNCFLLFRTTFKINEAAQMWRPQPSSLS